MKWKGLLGVAVALPLAVAACTQPDKRVDITENDSAIQPPEAARDTAQGGTGEVAPPS